jgi:hypothetical protein
MNDSRQMRPFEAGSGVRPSGAHPIGTWSWVIALPGADLEERDEQAVWEEIDD